MVLKKDTLPSVNLEGLKNESVCNEENYTDFLSENQVHISKRGFVIRQPVISKPKPENLKRRVAGDIGGWSKASRRRFRRFLMDYTEPIGWANYNLTMTVPGTVMTAKQYKELWHDFIKNLNRKKVLMVWRAEVQKRGAVHWHVILSMPKEESLSKISFLWRGSIENLGPLFNHVFASGYIAEKLDSRMSIMGAEKHCWDCKPENGSDAWWRYLCDHASKLKQEQIGHDIGRHWGVVGRKYAKPIFSDEVLCLSDQEMIWFRRFVRRLSTPTVKDEASPFGSRLGYSPNLSKNGRVDRFGHSKAVSKYLAYLREWCPDVPF